MDRVIFACKLRNAGIPVITELEDRKRDKMYKKAKEEACTVYDLDRVADQEELCYILKDIQK